MSMNIVQDDILDAIRFSRSDRFKEEETLIEYAELYRSLTNNRDPFVDEYLSFHFEGFVYGLLCDKMTEHLLRKNMEDFVKGYKLARSLF
ncbi:MAG: hypothetical protein NT129_01615 [Candidatus Aenigmarchaeota archaeon]|nr:hypothetical protein [Candidatus Aenigmarchaeota archaeon]